MSVLSRPYYHNEAEAFRYLESMLWADGIVCPHCGTVGGKVYSLENVRGSKSKKNPAGAIRHGLKECGDCHKQFTVKVGTVFEHGRIPLHKMLQAVYLLTSSKKGISSHQLSRTLEIQYKSAWFLAHRIREAMRDGSLAPFGGDRGIVEIDETYIGRVKGEPKARGGTRHKMKVLSLVDRRTGRSRSFVVDNTKIATVLPIIRANVAQEAICITDEAGIYTKLNKHGYDHGVVNHSADEWVRGLVHTNTIEGFFGIFKRGFKGIYQHCAEKNLHRYMAEYDFRYSNRQGNGVGDSQRAEIALKGIVGKRITYRWPD